MEINILCRYGAVKLYTFINRYILTFFKSYLKDYISFTKQTFLYLLHFRTEIDGENQKI